MAHHTSSQPSLPSLPIAAPTRRARRARTRAPVVNHEDESFNLDVSGSDDDDDVPANSPNPSDDPTSWSHNRDTGTDSQAGPRINNPDVLPSKVSTAADIHYFFKKEGDKMVCVECG